MRKLRQITAILLALLMLTSCTGNGDVTTNDPGTGVQTQAPVEEPVETKPSLTMTRAETGDGKYALEVKSDKDFDGKLTMTLKSESGEDTVVTEGSFKKDTEIVLISDKFDTIGESFTLTLTATEGGEEIDVLSCEYKEGKPQLSADSIELIVQKLTDREKTRLCVGWYAGQYSGKTYESKSFGIPAIIVSDGPNGPRVEKQSYAHPTSSLLGQTWDTELVYKIAESMGKDFKEYGIDIGLAPGINIQRNVLSGRNFEYFAEDPLLSGILGAAYINGVESTGTGTSLKHYIANNQEAGRQGDSILTERALREIYAKGFKYALRSSEPMTVMSSYNKINGVRSNSSYELITTLLKEEIGYDGVVFSDWGAQGEKHDMVNSGTDIYFNGQDNEGDATKLYKALKSGDLKPEALDNSVRNILKMVTKTHTFNGTLGSSMEISDLDARRTEMRALAAQGMVLLKNDNNTLPLKGGEVSVFGNASTHTKIGGYGSSLVNPSRRVSIVDGIENSGVFTLNKTLDRYYKNCEELGYYTGGELKDIEVLVPDATVNNAAKSSAAAIMTITRAPAEGYEIPDARGGYRLSENEEAMIRKISDAFHAQGKKLIVLLNVANPIETASWSDCADAILLVGFAGEETGDAAADILSGKVNPSGKLTCTWPVSLSDAPASEYPLSGRTYYYDDIYVGYRYYSTFGVNVAYPFGYGLSYTSFEYSDFSISSDKFTDELTATVTVKNTGNVNGREVVQFYVSKPDGVNEQAKYELCGFAKTKELAPGASETVTVKITKTELETYIEEKSDYVIEKGEYAISVGAAVTDIKGEKKFTVDDEILVYDATNICKLPAQIDILTKETGKVIIPATENIALGKAATADYSENQNTDAGNAIDGNSITRWSAPGGGQKGHYITIDLGKTYKLDGVKIDWESILVDEYEIYTSTDGENWTEKKVSVYQLRVPMDGVDARYVKILARNSNWLSIYEIAVYEKTN